MTDKQRKIFGEILDLNWDYDRAPDTKTQFELAEKLNAKKKELQVDMGDEAYNSFMSRGKEMFAPIKEN